MNKLQNLETNLKLTLGSLQVGFESNIEQYLKEIAKNYPTLKKVKFYLESNDEGGSDLYTKTTFITTEDNIEDVRSKKYILRDYVLNKSENELLIQQDSLYDIRHDFKEIQWLEALEELEDLLNQEPFLTILDNIMMKEFVL